MMKMECHCPAGKKKHFRYVLVSPKQEKQASGAPNAKSTKD